MKKRLSFFIIILIPLVFVAVMLFAFNRQRVVAVDVWGVATDDKQLTLEGTLLDVQQQFGPQVRLVLHYVADITKDGALQSFQTKRLDGAETTADLRTFDVEENTRRLVLQKYFSEQFFPYVRLQAEGRYRVGWEEIVRSLGLKSEKVLSMVKEKGEALLRKESEQLAQFRDATTNQLTVMPLLLIDGKQYEGSADFYSISAAVAKRLLRGNRDALGERGGIVRGIRECYADLHCDDKPTMDGACVDAGTATARCAYTKPLAMSMLILTPDKYDVARDAGRTALTRQFKGLIVTEQERSSTDGDAIEQRIQETLFDTGKEALRQAQGKKDKQQQLPDGIPLYLFSPSIEQSPLLQKFVDAGTVVPIKDVGYLVNPMPAESSKAK